MLVVVGILFFSSFNRIMIMSDCFTRYYLLKSQTGNSIFEKFREIDGNVTFKRNIVICHKFTNQDAKYFVKSIYSVNY